MRQALLLAAAGNALGLAPRAYAEAVLRVASIAKRRSARMVDTRTSGAALVGRAQLSSLIVHQISVKISALLGASICKTEEAEANGESCSARACSKFGLRN